MMTDERFWLRRYQRGDETAMTLRPDMAAQFAAQGRVLPRGERWTLCDIRVPGVIGIGGLEPSGAAASLGWFLTADLTPRQWLAGVEATRDRLTWARARGIRRIHALTPCDRPDAAAMLARLGFRLTGQEKGDAIMTRELI